MADEKDETTKRFSDLEELQQEVARRIRDNERFLERFLDDDFPEEEEEQGEEGEEDENFEEL